MDSRRDSTSWQGWRHENAPHLVCHLGFDRACFGGFVPHLHFYRGVSPRPLFRCHLVRARLRCRHDGVGAFLVRAVFRFERPFLSKKSATPKCNPGEKACTLFSSPFLKAVLLCSVSPRSEEHTSELQSRGHLVCRLL